MDVLLNDQYQQPGSVKYLSDESFVMSVPFGISGAMPRIPDEMLHGVAFLYPTKEQAAQNERVGGTGFLVSRVAPRASKAFGYRASIPFLISNCHVVWNSGCSVARFNRRDGGGTILDFGPENWVVHPDGDDVENRDDDDREDDDDDCGFHHFSITSPSATR